MVSRQTNLWVMGMMLGMNSYKGSSEDGPRLGHMCSCNGLR